LFGKGKERNQKRKIKTDRGKKERTQSNYGQYEGVTDRPPDVIEGRAKKVAYT